MPRRLAATFRAHNVDYDSSDSEVDDTKELQIEEALKLYQTALKFHSEGPGSFHEAQEAYRELFDSEIFTYAETLTEYQRWMTLPDYDELLQQTFDPVAQAVLTTGETAPNTLPQVLHLALKNRAQFMLDVVAHRVQESITLDNASAIPCKKDVQDATAAMQLYASALDKDEGDMDIWRRTARVSMWAGSYRIARFCLEAVLDGEQDGVESLLDMPGIDEMLASHELQHMIKQLEDDVADILGPVKTSMKRGLSIAMQKMINPYPALQRRSFGDSIIAMEHNRGGSLARHVVILKQRNWHVVGEQILEFLEINQDDRHAVQSCMLHFDLSQPAQSLVDIDSKSNARGSPGKATAKKSIPTKELHTYTGQASTEQNQEEGTIERDTGDQSHIKDEIEVLGDELPSEQMPQKDTISTTNPTRKRSTESAGLAENAEGGRSRSKRIRARWTTAGERIDVAQAEASKEVVVNEYQLESLKAADNLSYDTIQPIFERLEVYTLLAPAALDIMLLNGEKHDIAGQGPLDVAARDLYSALKSCEPAVVAALHTDSFGDNTMSIASRQAGINIFLGHDAVATADDSLSAQKMTDIGLDDWIISVNLTNLSVEEIACRWLIALFSPRHDSPTIDTPWSCYMHTYWSDDMKSVVRQIANTIETRLYDTTEELLNPIQTRYLKLRAQQHRFMLSPDELATIHVVQGLFEVFVDSFARTRTETLTGDHRRRYQEQSRLSRWSQLAMNSIRLYPAEDEGGIMTDLHVRHVWAQSTYVSLHEETSQEYNLSCVRDLNDIMRGADGRVIKLQNNDTISEISLANAEAKLRRLNMKDLFLRVFADEKDDDDSAISTIQTLEPLLNAVERISAEAQSSTVTPQVTEGNQNSEILQEIADFIASSHVSLRLSLWRRVRDAYQALVLKPMVTLCDFKSIDTIADEVQSSGYKELSEASRITHLLRLLRLADDLIVRILALKTDSIDILSCVASDQIKQSMRSLASLYSILHAFRVVDDQVTVGQCQTPGPSNRSHAAYTNLSSRMNDMIMRIWTLQYLLLKDGVEQFPEAFTNPYEDRLNFLRAVHHAAGPRSVCNAAKKVFLKLERDELLELSDHPDANWETCQVLFDLYGLKSTQHLNDLADHGCDNPEPLTRKAALRLLGFMLAQADKISIKDLLKAELKSALETVHEALGRPRASESNAMNKRVIASYIKGPVNPLNLYGSLKGALTLSIKTPASSDMPVASKGWYSLLGKTSLLKFKSVKRIADADTDDLDAALNFLLLDLEFACDRWDSWYHLGQVYDLQVQEAVSWNAEKLVGSSSEVLALQRQALNCYAMAVSCSIRNNVEEQMPALSNTIGELYADFGTRLYSSSREPFSMKAFTVKESEEKIFNRVEAPGSSKMYKAPSFVTLKLFSAWRLAAALLRSAIKRCPDRWLYHYTLGKCLWKMFTAPDSILTKNRRPLREEVTDAFGRAASTCPRTRGSKEEPILEPHYKVISIAHKMVARGLDFSDGADVVQVSSYASKITRPTDSDGWEEYVLKILKTLRSADKSSWHHRMTARAAHINYIGSGKDMFGALAAKHEFTQQMFTKTMALQVWRPACERPGRHFVYKTRYVRFFIELLERTKDKANFELLVRRLRKKASDYWEHRELWQDVCLVYLRILRASTDIPVNYDDLVFKGILHDEFLARADALEKWSKTAESNPILEVLRETAELKKLNGTYTKSLLIDELMVDAYSQLYAHVAGDLDIQGPAHGETVIAAGAPVVEGESVNNDDKLALTETTGKGRIKGVGRRELLRRAELAGFVATTTSMPTVSERKQSVRDKEGPANAGASLRRSVSVVVPAMRRVESVAVDLDTGSDSELSEMSNEEIEEIGEQLPSSIKNALGVRRSSAVAGAEQEEDSQTADGDDPEALKQSTKQEDTVEQGAEDADDGGTEGNKWRALDMDIDDQDDEDAEEDAEESADESIEQDDDQELADDADDEGENDASAMEVDESALVEEQMRLEIGS